MANVRTDDVQIKLDIDASQSKTELDNLSRKAQVIKNDLKEMRRGTDEYIAANKELREVNQRIAELHQELGTAGLSMTQLQNRSKALGRELKDLVPGTEEFISKSRQLAEVDNRLDQVRREVRGVRDELDNAGGGFLDFVKKSATFAGVQLGVEAVVGSLKELGSESIDAAKENSDAIADLEKSLNATTAEAQALDEQLSGIDTRTSQENLEGIAVAAGQLGIAKEEAVEFTTAVDQAVVALGDEFTGGVDDVTKSLGGLQKLFKETKDVSPADALLKIGSAVNALGADGTATGPVIADFTARIGQLGDLAPEITQTLGLGAAFQELGLSAEISAGGVSNVLLTAAKDTAGFGKQIGLTSEEFKELINNDPNEVLLRLAESFKGASNTEIVNTLDGLGIKSQEATKVVSLLASQTDIVRQKQALAAQEFEKGTSLTEEFTKKNTNAAAQIEKSEKKFARYREELGEKLIPVYIKALQFLGLFIEGLKAAPEFISENRALLAGLVVALVTLNLANIRATASTLIQLAAEKGRAVATRASAAAQVLLNAAMTANPIGLVVAAVALLIGGFITLYERSEKVRETIAGLGNVARVVFNDFKNVALETLGGVGKLLAGVFTGNLAQIREGLADLKGVGAKVSEAYHAGYEAQEAKEHAAATQRTAQRQQLRQKQAEDAAKKQADKVVAIDAAALLEQLKLREAALQRQLAQAKEGSEQELKIKKQLVLNARDQELLGEKKTAGDKAIIRAKAQVELDKLNQDYAKKQQELRQKEAEKARKQAEEEAEAEAANLRRRAELEVDEYKRKAAALRAAAVAEAQKLKGTEEQQAEGRRLIATKLERDLLALEKERVEKQEAIMRRIEQVDEDIALRRAERARVQAEKQSLFGGEAELETEKNARLAVLTSELDATLRNEQLTINERLALIRQFNADREQLDEEYAQHSKERRQQVGEFALEVTASSLQTLADFQKLASDKELAKIDKDKAARLKKLDAEYAAGKVSKEEYEKGKTAIETNYDAKARSIKREAAQKEKEYNIAQSIIQGVLAVLKAGGIFTPQGAATALFAALATTKIIATPIPEFAQGGIIGGAKAVWSGAKQGVGAAYRAMRTYAHGGRINPVAGVADVGQLHSNRGIQMIDGATGEHVGEWERGEPYMILSRDTYANNGDIIDALLDTSLHHGGAPIGRRGSLYAADGAVVGELPSSGPARAADQTAVVVAINRQTQIIQDGFSRQLPAVINWGAEDDAVLEDRLQERADVRDEFSA